jgi:hypothetical protein
MQHQYAVKRLLVLSLFSAAALQAQIMNFDLQYSSGNADSLSGSFAIDTADAGANSFYYGPLPSWLQNLTFSYTHAGTTTTYTRSDFTDLIWDPKGAVTWNSDLVPQFNDINFFGSQLDGVAPFTLQHVSSSSDFTMQSATPVPEPATWATITGAALAGFAFVRRRRTTTSHPC